MRLEDGLGWDVERRMTQSICSRAEVIGVWAAETGRF